MMSGVLFASYGEEREHSKIARAPA